MLNQTLRVPLAARTGLRADVHEVPGVFVIGTEDLVLGVVQEGDELVEEALPAFLGELPVEAVDAAPEHGAEVVHVFLGGHPVFPRGLGLVVCLGVWSLMFFFCLFWGFGSGSDG